MPNFNEQTKTFIFHCPVFFDHEKFGKWNQQRTKFDQREFHRGKFITFDISRIPDAVWCFDVVRTLLLVVLFINRHCVNQLSHSYPRPDEIETTNRTELLSTFNTPLFFHGRFTISVCSTTLQTVSLPNDIQVRVWNDKRWNTLFYTN